MTTFARTSKRSLLGADSNVIAWACSSSSQVEATKRVLYWICERMSVQKYIERRRLRKGCEGTNRACRVGPRGTRGHQAETRRPTSSSGSGPSRVRRDVWEYPRLSEGSSRQLHTPQPASLRRTCQLHPKSSRARLHLRSPRARRSIEVRDSVRRVFEAGQPRTHSDDRLAPQVLLQPDRLRNPAESRSDDRDPDWVVSTVRHGG